MIPCDTCDCVGIRSIVNNSNGTTTITLTNGTATTYQSRGLTGPQGPAGPAGEDGVYIIANQFPNLATTTTNFESLLDGRVPYSMPANTMNTNLDDIEIIAQATCSNTDAQKLTITFNGVDLFGVADWPTFYGSVQLIKLFIRLTRITNTTAKYYAEAKFYGEVPAPSNSRALLFQGELDLTALAGFDFTGSAINIDFQARSIEVGDVTSNYFEVVYKHYNG